MIDLRKNKSEHFYIDKRTLEILEGDAHYNILRLELATWWYGWAGYEGCKKEYNKNKKILSHYIKISREECKEFRNMDNDTKKLFIELKED